jgi:hypothetical protein
MTVAHSLVVVYIEEIPFVVVVYIPDLIDHHVWLTRE